MRYLPELFYPQRCWLVGMCANPTGSANPRASNVLIPKRHTGSVPQTLKFYVKPVALVPVWIVIIHVIRIRTLAVIIRVVFHRPRTPTFGEKQTTPEGSFRFTVRPQRHLTAAIRTFHKCPSQDSNLYFPACLAGRPTKLKR